MTERRRQNGVDLTRKRVVEAAIELFGGLGYEATSTRALGQRAGTSLTVIRYHFGGKDGLYRAAAETVAEGIRQRLHASLESVDGLATAPAASRDELIQGLGTLVELLAAKFMGGLPDSWAKFITREQFEPSGSFDILFHAMRPLFDTLTDLVGQATGRPRRGAEARLLAMTLFGQVAVFRSHRATALRTLGWREFGPAEQRQVRAAVRTHVVALLTALANTKAPAEVRRVTRAGARPRRGSARRASEEVRRGDRPGVAALK